MSQPDPQANDTTPHYGRYVGLLGLVIVILITLNTILTKPNGAVGITPGNHVPPFAVPLAQSKLEGDADVATRAHEGQAGNISACQERGPEILNICQLYENSPVVLALFVDDGACPAVLSDMQALTRSFPQVRFAAVSIKGSRKDLRSLIKKYSLGFPLGIDKDGALAELYKVSSCPQLTFAYPGGVVQSKALLIDPPLSTLRARVAELLTATRARNQTTTG